ncbi:MAG: hypothetical protein EA393_05985 [Bacteroidetes bacterium]|nr:MAG: hypothetical protein EA393_05985 [Bacteroidota bacterium]
MKSNQNQIFLYYLTKSNFLYFIEDYFFIVIKINLNNFYFRESVYQIPHELMTEFFSYHRTQDYQIMWNLVYKSTQMIVPEGFSYNLNMRFAL